MLIRFVHFAHFICRPWVIVRAHCHSCYRYHSRHRLSFSSTMDEEIRACLLERYLLQDDYIYFISLNQTHCYPWWLLVRTERFVLCHFHGDREWNNTRSTHVYILDSASKHFHYIPCLYLVKYRHRESISLHLSMEYRTQWCNKLAKFGWGLRGRLKVFKLLMQKKKKMTLNLEFD